MKALITGASSGMGKSAAYYLSNLGYDLILVARSKEKLEQIKAELKTDVKIFSMDLSIEENLYKLYEETRNLGVDLLINNAGFGIAGEFVNTDLKEELNMIDLNIKAYHVLTKLFLRDMVNRDSGHILNVASAAGLTPGGPLLNTYYATKSYLVSLDNAIYEELRRKRSNVHISSFCPGPVETAFNDRANVKFAVKGLDSDKVMKYAINKALKNKMIIVPSFQMKLLIFSGRIFSKKLMLKISYMIQKAKEK